MLHFFAQKFLNFDICSIKRKEIADIKEGAVHLRQDLIPTQFEEYFTQYLLQTNEKSPKKFQKNQSYASTHTIDKIERHE